MSADNPTSMSPGLPGLSFPGVGAGLAVLRDGKLLLYKRRKPPEAGHWNILGGKVDHMEPAITAAAREAEEESGLAIRDLTLLCHSEKILPEDGQHWISLIYMTTTANGEPRMAEPDKFFDFGWFGPDALPQPLSRFAADAVEALREKGLL
jgi:8-oxo-dGTP diphosphatase